MSLSKKHRRIKRWLFGFAIGLLFIPMLQQQGQFFKEINLNGSFTNTQNPELAFKSWFSGDYQQQKQQYINERFGFRPLFIRLYNQMYYSLFQETRANDVIIGKDGYLYGESYINAYTGTDFIGLDSITKKVRKLARVRDTLEKKGIKLIMVLAPGKGSFYSEYIPAKFKKLKQDTTNYFVLKEQLDNAQIHTLDFHDWFMKMKDTSRYPLFPKTGIHWSKYGEVLVADSLLNYLQRLLDKPMPSLEITGLEVSKKMRDTDDDIEKGMNIFTSIPDLEMAYYETAFTKDSIQDYPRISVVADSYYWGLHNMGISENGFNQGDFWYYFQEVHHTDGRDMEAVTSITNHIERIEENDAMIILTTDGNMSKFDHGFTDWLYERYFPDSTATD